MSTSKRCLFCLPCLLLVVSLLVGCTSSASSAASVVESVSASSAAESVSASSAAESTSAAPVESTPAPTATPAATLDVPAADSEAAAQLGAAPNVVTGYRNATPENDASPIPLYAQPDTSHLLATIPGWSAVWVLQRQNDWLYVLWGNQYGWIENAALPQGDGDNVRTLQLPEALSAGQQLEFLRATNLFDAYICRCSGLDTSAHETAMVPIPGQEGEAPYIFDNAWASYADFDAAMNELFTADFLEEQRSIWLPTQEIEGRLGVAEADRGSWECDVKGYTLTEQTDTRISLEAQMSFTTPIAEHTCTLPIVMEKGTDGQWRFSDFTSGSDDTHWMDAMGDDFDVWEGQE